MFNQKDIDRFWIKVKIKGPNDCWLWLAGKNHEYGQFKWKNRHYRAHVFAFMLTNDIILSGRDIIIRHKCNNPPCCNPNHLIEGTDKDNMRDSIIAGTHKIPPLKKGENCNLSKLTEEDIRKIRQLGLTMTGHRIAKLPEWKNKISRGGIYCILNYQSWKHIK